MTIDQHYQQHHFNWTAYLTFYVDLLEMCFMVHIETINWSVYFTNAITHTHARLLTRSDLQYMHFISLMNNKVWIINGIVLIII